MRYIISRDLKIKILIKKPEYRWQLFRAGATYVSPFIGRLEDTGVSGIELIKNIRDTFDKHRITTEIIGASIRNPFHVEEIAKAGAHIGTLPFKVIESMIKHPLTDAGIQKFLADWEKISK